MRRTSQRCAERGARAAAVLAQTPAPFEQDILVQVFEHLDIPHRLRVAQVCWLCLVRSTQACAQLLTVHSDRSLATLRLLLARAPSGETYHEATDTVRRFVTVPSLVPNDLKVPTRRCIAPLLEGRKQAAQHARLSQTALARESSDPRRDLKSLLHRLRRMARTARAPAIEDGALCRVQRFWFLSPYEDWVAAEVTRCRQEHDTLLTAWLHVITVPFAYNMLQSRYAFYLYLQTVTGPTWTFRPTQPPLHFMCAGCLTVSFVASLGWRGPAVILPSGVVVFERCGPCPALML